MSNDDLVTRLGQRPGDQYIDWATRAEAAARITELEAEIARHHTDFARWEEKADKGAAQLAENARLREALGELRTDFGRIANIAAQHNAGAAALSGEPTP